MRNQHQDECNNPERNGLALHKMAHNAR
jgi:hypothetical protein